MSRKPTTLESDRLLLRAFELTDASDVQSLAGDWAVAEMTTNIPHPYEDGMAEGWIATHSEIFERGDGVTWAITLRDGGELAGAMSLFNMKAGHKAELGFWIGRPFWGDGYCTEAAQAVVEHAFGSLGLTRIHAVHMSKNPASGRVMQKLGMTYEGTRRSHLRARGQLHDVVQYGLLKEDAS
ncbi:MAG: GNAT family N-acetyltransferase [Myxococcota bacterium]|nr:GNAT family N-acetyltransferase [Myxococcota bacterium]